MAAHPPRPSLRPLPFPGLPHCFLHTAGTRSPSGDWPPGAGPGTRSRPETQRSSAAPLQQPAAPMKTTDGDIHNKAAAAEEQNPCQTICLEAASVLGTNV